jgi:hypothetical protein
MAKSTSATTAPPPPRKFWIAVHKHRHGEDLYPFFDVEPTERQIMRAIKKESDFEKGRDDEYLDDTRGPFYVPEPKKKSRK